MEKYLSYLPYITDISKTLITTIGVVVGLGVSLWKYLNTLRMEQKRLNYENFKDLINTLSISFRNKDHWKSTPEMISMIYQLSSFKSKEYSQISLAVLDFYKEELQGHNLSDVHKLHIGNAIKYVINELTMTKLDRFFASLRMTVRRLMLSRSDSLTTVE
jgi:hypothetical protein